MDDADFGRTTNAPLLILQAAESHTQAGFDNVLDVWRGYAELVGAGPSSAATE